MGDKRIVAAIDFGTCNTRVCFARNTKDFKSLEFFEMDDWKLAPHGRDMAPTSVLLDKKGDPLAYGFEAEDMFKNREEEDHFYFFKNFKMELHDINEFKPQHKLKALSNPEHFTVLQVISASLKYLSDLLIDFIQMRIGLEIEKEEIQWVLTVPAIWKPEARNIMRKAAYQAKLCTVRTHRNLTIALEPECAAFYVRNQEERNPALEASHYAVVDCGGGTVDIAYHSVVSQKDEENQYVIRELAAPKGGAFGGTLVDRAFEEEILERVFGVKLRDRGDRTSRTPFVDRLKNNYPEVWLALMEDFELKKTLLDTSKEDASICFDLTMKFDRACRNFTGLNAYDILENTSVAGVSLSRTEQMQIKASKMKSLYDEPVNELCKVLSHDIRPGNQKLSRISAIYMVGTFSKSKYLMQRVKEAIGNRVGTNNIINPQDSHFAIAKGAIMFGIHPGIIEERVATRSYGKSCVKSFVKSEHPQSKKEFFDNEAHCIDLYSEFIEYGQTLKTSGDPIKLTCVPAEEKQDGMTISFYAAPRNVTFVDEPGCKYLATLQVSMKNTEGGKKREVHLEIFFGGTEFHAVAKDETTGATVDTVFEFVPKSA